MAGLADTSFEIIRLGADFIPEYSRTARVHPPDRVGESMKSFTIFFSFPLSPTLPTEPCRKTMRKRGEPGLPTAVRTNVRLQIFFFFVNSVNSFFRVLRDCIKASWWNNRESSYQFENFDDGSTQKGSSRSSLKVSPCHWAHRVLSAVYEADSASSSGIEAKRKKEKFKLYHCNRTKVQGKVSL